MTSPLLLVSVIAFLVYAQSVDSAPAAAAGQPPKAALAAALATASTEAPSPPPPFSAGVRYDQRQTGNLNVQVDLKDVEIYAIFDDSLFGSLGARWHKLRKSHPKQKHHHPTALTIQRISQDYEYDYSQLTERPTSTMSSSSSSTPSSSPSSNGTSATKSSASGAEGGTSARPITIFFTRKTVAEPPKSSLPLSSSDTNQPANNTSLKIVTNEIAERRSSSSEDNDPQLRSNEPSASALLSSSIPSTQEKSTSRPIVVSTSLKPSVANRRCGAGFHRDASGRCRRNRRPLRNKNSSTKNGSSKSKSSSVPRTLGKDSSRSGASQQEQSVPSKPASDNRETVQNLTTAQA